MKKILISVVVAMCGLPVFAQNANRMKYVEIMPNNIATGTVNGAAVDVAAYKGNATLIFDHSKPVLLASGYASTVSVQQSATGTSAWTIVTNILGDNATKLITGNSTDGIQTYPIDLARVKKYLRAVAVNTGDTGAVSVTLVAPQKAE